MMEPPALDLTLCKSKCIELLAKDCAEGADRLDLSAKEGDAAQLADHFADHLVGHWAKLLNATALPTGSLRCGKKGRKRLQRARTERRTQRFTPMF